MFLYNVRVKFDSYIKDAFLTVIASDSDGARRVSEEWANKEIRVWEDQAVGYGMKVETITVVQLNDTPLIADRVVEVR